MRNINAAEIVGILNNSFGYTIVDTPIGLGVELGAYDAFIFSAITGAGYLENKVFPYTPKGQMKVFQNVFENKFVTGLLENFSFRYSPYYLNASREFLFFGKKIIVPVEFNDERELRTKLNLLSEFNNPDYLVLRLETYKKGFGLEPFLEYLVCRYFNRLGYITENQIPLFPTVGSPDFGGFKNYSGFELNGLELFNKGFNILELSLIRLFSSADSQQFFDDNPHVIVGEAKTSTTNIAKQIQKYIETGLYNEAIEIFPSYQSSSHNSLFYVDSKLSLRYEKKSDIKVDFKKQELYLSWIKNYFKYYILSNYSNDEFRLYFKYATGMEYNDNKFMIEFVEQISIGSLLVDLKKYIAHGTFK